MGPLASVLVTVGAIGLAAFLTFVLPTPLPIKGALYALPLGAIVYASYSGRPVVALASAALGSAYALLHYDSLGGIFPRRMDRLLLGGTVVVITFAMSLAAIRARRLHDAAAARAIELEHAHAAELAAKNAELERSNHTLEAFTYVVSHDLKEPARALSQLTRALQEDHAASLDEGARSIVRQSVDAAVRLETLLTGLLDYSRAAQIRPHELEDLTLAEVVEQSECFSRYDRVMRERGGRLDVEPGPAVRASLTGLCQVVGNLVLNSLKHGRAAPPTVRVSSRPNDHDATKVDIIVEDDGPGYPPALVDQFNRASRGRPTTLRGGFGLIIAREAAEKMGGAMMLAKAPSGGARTVITLPRGLSKTR